MKLCAICEKPEGNDPKAHTCEFNCGACGQFFDESEADENNHHIADACDASDEIGLLCNLCGNEMTDEEEHSLVLPFGEICEECTNEIKTIKENN